MAQNFRRCSNFDSRHRKNVFLFEGVKQITEKLVEIRSGTINEYSAVLREMVSRAYEELLEHNARIEDSTARIVQVAKTNEQCKLITSIPGMGPINAVAIVARMGNVQHYKNGRAFSSSLGLTPKEYSSGGKQKLSRISKQGDSECRSLIIQGARNQSRYWAMQPAGSDRRKAWFQGILARKNKWIAVVALANKIARTVYAVLKSGKPYKPVIA